MAVRYKGNKRDGQRCLYRTKEGKEHRGSQEIREQAQQTSELKASVREIRREVVEVQKKLAWPRIFVQSLLSTGIVAALSSQPARELIVNLFLRAMVEAGNIIRIVELIVRIALPIFALCLVLDVSLTALGGMNEFRWYCEWKHMEIFRLVCSTPLLLMLLLRTVLWFKCKGVRRGPAYLQLGIPAAHSL